MRREVARLRQVDLATALGLFQPQVARLEAGTRRPQHEEVDAWVAACVAAGRRRLADADSITVADHRRLTAALQRITSDEYHQLLDQLYDQVWNPSTPNSVLAASGLDQRQRDLARLDERYGRMRHWQPLYVPGVLMPPRLAELVMASYDLDGADHEERWRRAAAGAAARVDRGQRLRAGVAPRAYHAILTEAALNFVIDVDGQTNDPAESWQAVAAAAELPHITIQIVPAGRPWTLVSTGAWVFYDQALDPDEKPLVMVDMTSRQQDIWEPRELTMYETSWRHLQEEMALPPSDSLELLRTTSRGDGRRTR